MMLTLRLQMTIRANGGRDDRRHEIPVTMKLRDLLKREGATVPAEPTQVELSPVEAGQLASVFAPPRWLRDLGRAAWLLVGVFALLAGLVWLLATTETIVTPLIAAAIVATVTAPIVRVIAAHRLNRAAGAAIVVLGVVALAALVAVVVIGGITSQDGAISREAAAAADKAEGWLTSLGVDKSGASSAKAGVEKDVPAIIGALVTGVIHGIKGLTSVVFGLSLAMLSLFFLLKDGPSMRRWIDGHLGVPAPVAQTITGGIIRSLRGYFRGVTIVAAFNGVVVTLAAILLGVPLAGTIGVVTFVTAYVPYLGAFVSGAFAVVIALGAKGTAIAVAMLIVVILANGLLQNLVQPFAMGSALDLNPLVVLVVTIASGCVFGMVGLILAAPLTSAAVHITRDLARARATAAAQVSAEGTPAVVPPSGAPTVGA
jgi:predicted PurR-regulated permease PerM